MAPGSRSALRKTTDWRWPVDRGDSPWYPTLRLFRRRRRCPIRCAPQVVGMSGRHIIADLFLVVCTLAQSCIAAILALGMRKGLILSGRIAAQRRGPALRQAP
jgi:hypothetical protein